MHTTDSGVEILEHVKGELSQFSDCPRDQPEVILRPVNLVQVGPGLPPTSAMANRFRRPKGAPT
jgi:hypothetical protein